MKTKELNLLMYAYIINAIDGEAYDRVLNTDVEKLSFLKETFIKEYMFPDNLKRYKTEENVFKEWIMGLPSCFNVDFKNYAIIELLKTWGMLSDHSSDRVIDHYLETWFTRVANETFKLFRRYSI